MMSDKLLKWCCKIAIELKRCVIKLIFVKVNVVTLRPYVPMVGKIRLVTYTSNETKPRMKHPCDIIQARFEPWSYRCRPTALPFTPQGQDEWHLQFGRLTDSSMTGSRGRGSRGVGRDLSSGICSNQGKKNKQRHSVSFVRQIWQLPICLWRQSFPICHSEQWRLTRKASLIPGKTRVKCHQTIVMRIWIINIQASRPISATLKTLNEYSS